MISVRTKLIFFNGLLIVAVSAVSSTFLLIHSRRQLESELKELGNTLITMFSISKDFKDAMKHKQYSLLDTPIENMKFLDREKEIGYWKISSIDAPVRKGKAPGLTFMISDVPFRNPMQDPHEIKQAIGFYTDAGDEFYDFFIPVLAKGFFFDDDDVFDDQFLAHIPFGEKGQKIVGYVQIGLTTHVLNEKLRKTIKYIIVPMGFGIIICGYCIIFILNRYIGAPLQYLTNVTKVVSKGEFCQMKIIKSDDEIGQLSLDFNLMTEKLKVSDSKLKQEIALRKLTETMLRESEKRHKVLLEHIPQRIFYKDTNLVYISCNDNYANDLKIKLEDIRGKVDKDFYSMDLADKYNAADERIMKTDQTTDVEEVYFLDNRELIIQKVRTPIKDETGKAVGMLCIFWDITLKTALRNVAIRNRHLASIGELSAGVAHEINNPLNGMINCAQMICNKINKEIDNDEVKVNLKNEIKDLSGRIVQEGVRVSKIVRNLLSFVRPGSKDDKMSFANVNDIVINACSLSQMKFQKDNICLNIRVSKRLPEVFVHPQKDTAGFSEHFKQCTTRS